MSTDCELENLNVVFRYHQQTKHDYHRFADGPGYLDWVNQPDPFRRYPGVELISLPLDTEIKSPLYGEIFHPGSFLAKEFNVQSISCLLRNSMALSAWKQAGDSRWALRINPSSGNLHPTEAYLLLPAMDGLSSTPMVGHYAPREHGLEIRCALSEQLWQSLTIDFEDPILFIGMSSIYWREAWKYGARAYRYCQLDVGHALAAISLAAASLGWHCQMLHNLSDQQLRMLFGLPDNHHAETEQPECLIAITPTKTKHPVLSLPDHAIEQIGLCEWQGEANILSQEHVSWDAINNVAVACEKSLTDISVLNPLKTEQGKSPEHHSQINAHDLFQQRRSAVAMDRLTKMQAVQFYNLLSRLMPDTVDTPFNLMFAATEIQLILFVHRVEGISPGVYCLIRDPGALDALKTQMDGQFSWKKPETCPAEIPLYCLVKGDAKEFSQQLSCRQQIAADGCFSLAMLSRFEQTMRQTGAWLYPRLYWECGMIGQVLYLEAEAQGIQGTGIGCFFDDPVHDFLGLHDMQFQNLYHFTIGGAVEDSRILTLPAYSTLTSEDTLSL